MAANPVGLVRDVPDDLAAAYAAYLADTGRGNVLYERSARQFLHRWPDPQAWASEPLETRLSADKHTRPLLTFLMLHAGLRPGYDYLVTRKLTPLWRELPGSAYAADLQRFVAATVELGYAQPVARGVGSQVMARLLIQTGRGLDGLQDTDLDELTAALIAREQRSGIGWRHYRVALHAARTALFHLGVLTVPPPNPHEALRQSFERRLHAAAEPLRPRLVAYLERLTATHARGTISGIATRLGHFARHLATVDPELGSLAELDRQRHIETYLSAVAAATRPVDGLPISVSERRARIISVNRFLADITEWGWPDAPARQLLFPRDVPRLPRPLPRYLPADVDRQLVAALHASPNRQRALALLLQRACGLRVGELVDLELDCVHEVAGHGVWLKVPLGKLDTERMVPIDDETVMLIDELAALRSPGRPLPHPGHGRPVEFLLTHHGSRVSTSTLQKELRATALAAGLEPVSPHQLRHTFATAMVNAGVPLQTLMVLLGHVSAQMSLRYGRLFDATVRDDYERALTQAKAHLGGPVLPPAETNRLPLAGDWKDAPAIKTRMAGGYCIRTLAQGSCAYANICEHCPNYRSDPTFLAILATQKADAAALAADAQARGWIDEADRHLQLIERLDALISHNQAS
ncbi:MAG: phage integrase family protein [Nitriliruptor sp.]|nr:MAG: phage integrase family protein [Nitriliruptor sp.]